MWYNFFGDFMLIDTHCHLNKADYENVDDIIKNMNGIMIASGCSDESNKEVLELIEKYPNVYGTIGIHPEEVNKVTEESFKIIEANINNPKIVAIGEIGLDYYWVKDNKESQKELFEKQLLLATKYNKPIIVHSRDSIQDTYDILKKYKLKGSIHCFNSSIEMAKEFIKLGYKLGIGGVVSFKNAQKLQEIVKKIDLKYMLLETDSPYLTPEPYRGRRNEPSNVLYVAKKIAELKNVKLDEILKITNDTAIEIFDLKY